MDNGVYTMQVGFGNSDYDWGPGPPFHYGTVDTTTIMGLVLWDPG